MGEAPRKAMGGQQGAIALDTFGGRIHVEWDPAAAVTPLGQLLFFIEFLKVSSLFEAWVADCPLAYHSNHASETQAVLTNVAGFLSALKVTAKQWTEAERLRAMLPRAFATFMISTAAPPTVLISKTAAT